MPHATIPPPIGASDKQPTTTSTVTEDTTAIEKVTAYPTDARERQKVVEKARKLAGIAPKRKQQRVEDHHDDCGESLDGLGLTALTLDAYTDDSDDYSTDDVKL